MISPGDTYLWDARGGLSVRATGEALAELPSMRAANEVASAIPEPRQPIEPDPVNEAERSLIGAAILGIVDIDTIDRHVLHIDHRRIVDALAGTTFTPEHGLATAHWCCREAGLPPELRGLEVGDTVVGYLAGCVDSAPRDARAVDEVIQRLEAGRAWA